MFAPRVPSVSATEVAADAYVIDVREDDEWAAGHAPDAVHLPMMEIPARLDEIPTGQDVVVVCRVGGRSAQVVAFLTGRGWDNVRNLDGGMVDWVAAGRPLVSDGGQAPRIL